MSHYTCGIILPRDIFLNCETDRDRNHTIRNVICEIMEPYDENLPPGSPYLRFKDDTEEIVKEYLDRSDELGCLPYQKLSLEEYMRRFHPSYNSVGFISSQEDSYQMLIRDYQTFSRTWNGKPDFKVLSKCIKIGYFNNPDAKYDYYSIYPFFIPTKNKDNVTWCKLKDISLKYNSGQWEGEYFSTYCFINKNEEWIAPGVVGWFGSSTACKESQEIYQFKFHTSIFHGDPEAYFVVLDCHI